MRKSVKNDNANKKENVWIDWPMNRPNINYLFAFNTPTFSYPRIIIGTQCLHHLPKIDFCVTSLRDVTRLWHMYYSTLLYHFLNISCIYLMTLSTMVAPYSFFLLISENVLICHFTYNG